MPDILGNRYQIAVMTDIGFRDGLDRLFQGSAEGWWPQLEAVRRHPLVALQSRNDPGPVQLDHKIQELFDAVGRSKV